MSKLGQRANQKVRRLKKEVQFWRSLLVNTSEAVVFTDLENKILFANPAAEVFFGHIFQDMQGRNVLDFANGSRDEINQKLAKLSKDGALKDLQISFATKYQNNVQVSLTIDVICEEKVKKGILWIIQDLSVVAALERELKDIIAKLKKETRTDYLMQISNRRYFEKQLSREIKRVERYDRGLALLFLDIDDFKKGINDKYGHTFGDEVLKAVAAALKDQVRETDFLARWGGEEFVVICPETEKDGATGLAEKIRKTIEESEFFINKEKIRLTMSIGVANFIPNGTEEGLIKKANLAMHYAKNNGRNCIWHASWPIEQGV